VAGVALALSGGAVAAASSSWTTYHADAARSGVDPSEPSLSPLKPVWAAALDGVSIYGQPVVADGRVFVGTEDDNVYGLNAHNGQVLWHANIGQPLRNVTTQVGCGDIDPLGITSTPVIDLSTNTVYVVGEVSNHGALPVHHKLVGFNVVTGQVVRSASADPVLTAGQDLQHLQQRAALAVGHGRVYVAYGGLAGDCGNYHGWIVGVSETGASAKVQFDTTPGARGGAIWEGGGGPSIDAAGNVYATTGNPLGTASVVKYGDDIIKLDANLDAGSVEFLHDSAAVPNSDSDLGTGDATLIPPGTGHTDADVFAVGKTDVGYLVRQSKLSLVATIPNVCGSNPDGGEAYDAATNSIYVPCRGGGIQQVRLGTHALGWRAGGVNGAPILVAGNLWAAGYNGGPLQELNPATGAVMQSVSTASLPTFASPSAALGLLLLGTTHGVAAFDGPSGPPPSAPPPPGPRPPSPSHPTYDLVASDGGVFPFATGFYGSTGGIALNGPVVAMASVP
jgi:outer membrane protein assembly factor BamB